MENRISAAQIIIAICFAGLFFWFGSNYKHKPTETIKVDTLIVHHWDTAKIEIPTEKIRYVVRTDTIKVVIIDTNGNLKPAEALLPIERAIYQDSTQNAKYTAYLSGFRPVLDSIQINCLQTETIIEKIERENRRIGLGVQLGVGVTDKGFSPYLGLGVQYRLW